MTDALGRESAVRPFSKSGYEILDDRRGDVVIWSVDPVRPRLGDLLLIERDGAACDMAVEELAVLKGGWSARCRSVPALKPPRRRRA